MSNPAAGAASIFDREEPIGRATDHFPGAARGGFRHSLAGDQTGRQIFSDFLDAEFVACPFERNGSLALYATDSAINMNEGRCASSQLARPASLVNPLSSA